MKHSMSGVAKVNWWAIIAVVFCLGIWGVGVLGLAKTANIAAHPKEGFVRDMVVHARNKWAAVKSVVTPISPAPAAAPADQHKKP